MEQVTGFAGRFQLSRAASSRGAELYRLAEVKGVRGVSSTGLALACLEISASQLGETFDKTQAQKLSGLQPRAYCSVVQSVGKMLNLTMVVSLREMAVRFGCLEAEQLANDILKNYREKVDTMYSETQKEGLDLTKPLFTAAALYTACKTLKFRSDKSQFQSVASCLSRVVFQTILDQMKECIPKTGQVTDGRTLRSGRKRRRRDKAGASEGAAVSSQDGEPTDAQREKEDSSGQDGGGTRGPTMMSSRSKFKRESLWSRVVSSPTSEDYLQWKEAILTAARAKLPQ